jgi:hypothetical protein
MVERRDFLKKAAAGTGALAIPMIVTVDPADAQAVTSPPPQPPGSGIEPVNRPGTAPGGAGNTGGGPTPASGRTELPRTGADVDRMVAAGLAATVGGAALVLWSAHMKAQAMPASPSPSPGPADPEAET